MVVQGTLMRVTIHLVSQADYWPLARAVRDARRTLWLRATRHAVSAETLAASATVVRERVREGPIRRTDIDTLVGKDRSIGVGLWEDFVRVPPSGTWERRRADLYAAAEDWLGPPPAGLTMEAATEHLVRRYLQGFGPATAADAADWGGLRTADVQAVLDRIDVVRFTTDDGMARCAPSLSTAPSPVRGATTRARSRSRPYEPPVDSRPRAYWE